MLDPESMLLQVLGADRALQYWEYYLDDVLKFVRAGTDQSEEALAVAFATVGVAQANVFSQEQFDNYNAMTQSLLRKMYLSAPETWGQIEAPMPTSGEAFEKAVLPQVRGVLLNEDELRTFASRRVAVDALKAMQTTAAYQVLIDAKAALAGSTDLEQTDLVARIERATSPYFNE
jgi:hypothetical protein